MGGGPTGRAGSVVPVTDVTIHRLDRRPDLIERIYEFDDGWPEFMGCDPVADAVFGRIAREFPHVCVAAVDDAGAMVARGRSVPFALGGEHRAELPDGGLDRILVWAFRDLERGTPPTAASAVEIAIDPAHRGRGLSHRMLAALAGAVADAGLATLVAPVRPNRKADPGVPMAAYAFATRADGLPVDAWLRVHVRAGGRIVKVAPASMAMPGSLADWREWTGLPFDVTGDVLVPGALVPVRCDVENDYAVYVEPNVWVWHDVSGRRTAA
jgi:GNAT superfamily N-acetyltransferase